MGPDPFVGTAVAIAADRALIEAVLARRGLRIRDFMRPSSLHGCAYIAACWLAVSAGATFWFVGGYWTIVAIPIFALAQHGLLMLTHEACHLNLFPGKKLNSLAADLLLALPIGQTVHSYTLTHLPHHTHLNTAGDTAFFATNPSHTWGRVCWLFLSFLFGRTLWDLALRTWSGGRLDRSFSGAGSQAVSATERRRAIAVLAYHIPLVVAAYAWNSLDLWVVWTICSITMIPVIDGIRVIAEHRRGSRDGSTFHTRSHHVNWALSYIFSPFFQYHWEHHAVPGVPHCRLGRLHRLLVDEGVDQARPVPGGIFGAFVRGIS